MVSTRVPLIGPSLTQTVFAPFRAVVDCSVPGAELVIDRELPVLEKDRFTDGAAVVPSNSISKIYMELAS